MTTSEVHTAMSNKETNSWRYIPG